METRLRRLEAVQEVVLEISRMSISSDDLAGFLRSVHQSISRIMYAANFYVAIFDEEQNSLRFVYGVDELDTFPLDGAPIAGPSAWHFRCDGDSDL